MLHIYHGSAGGSGSRAPCCLVLGPRQLHGALPAIGQMEEDVAKHMLALTAADQKSHGIPNFNKRVEG